MLGDWSAEGDKLCVIMFSNESGQELLCSAEEREAMECSSLGPLPKR